VGGGTELKKEGTTNTILSFQETPTVFELISIPPPDAVFLEQPLADFTVRVQLSQLIRNPLIRNLLLLGTDFDSPIFTKELVQFMFIRNSGY